MSDVAMTARGEAAAAGFGPRTVALMLAVGILGFVGMLVMGAYAPDLRSGRNGGAHALSTAAVGYTGLVRLAEATDRHPRIIRNDHLLGGENLLVMAPEHGVVNIAGVLAQRQGKVTLLVLPKWATAVDARHAGWVTSDALLAAFDPQGVLAPATKLTIRRARSGGRPLVNAPDVPAAIAFHAPRPLQTVSGGKLEPVVSDGAGGIVLGKLPDQPLYVLADPDLLANIGMRDARQAASALALLDWLNSNEADGIDFDVTLNGFGHSLSPLKLAFDPPFLAMTLAIAAALLLVGVQALARFGSPRSRERAIAFGKTALVDNAAALIRKAGREATLGRRYADVVRDRAATVFGAPARLRDKTLDVYLDRLGGRGRFTDLAAAATDATDRASLLGAARALHEWRNT